MYQKFSDFIRDKKSICVIQAENPDGDSIVADSIDFFIQSIVEPLPIPEIAWRMHPDDKVDLCAFAIGPILNALKDQGKYAKISCLPMEIIPSAEEIGNMFQLDEVVMIGYPNGILDEVNNQPIFRRGTLATKPSLDYNGRKEFLVDMAVYGGSSGSPVFVYREGFWYDKQHGGAVLMNHPTARLIGIMQGVFTSRVDGRIIVKEIPTALGAFSESSVPNNLGVAIKAERIKELEALF